MPTCAPSRCEKARISRAVVDRDAGTEHDVRLDGDVLAEFGVGGQKHRLRRDHGDAGVHRGGAQALLQHGFGFGKLRLGIDAAHVVLLGFDRHRLQAHLAGNGNRIGQIVFALGVGIADPLENRQRLAAGKRHQPAIAEADFALVRAGVALFADGDELIALRHQPAIAGRVGRPESKHRDRCALRQRRAQRASVCGRTSGVSANITRISSAPRASALRAASTACAVPRRSRLLENLRLGRDAQRLLGDRRRAPGPTTTAMSRAAGLASPRPAHARAALRPPMRMQHFRQRRAHARAFAGRQHDREARSRLIT